jgi:hypothetical protein
MGTNYAPRDEFAKVGAAMRQLMTRLHADPKRCEQRLLVGAFLVERVGGWSRLTEKVRVADVAVYIGRGDRFTRTLLLDMASDGLIVWRGARGRGALSTLGLVEADQLPIAVSENRHDSGVARAAFNEDSPEDNRHGSGVDGAGFMGNNRHEPRSAVPDLTRSTYEKYSPPTPQGTQRSLLIHAVRGEGETGSTDKPDSTTEAARTLLASLPAPFNRLGPVAVDDLTPDVAARLAGGWSAAALTTALTSKPAARPAGALRWRLDNEIPVNCPAPAQAAPARRTVREVLSAACPKCHSTNGQPGWVTDPNDPDRDKVIRCTDSGHAAMVASA